MSKSFTAENQVHAYFLYQYNTCIGLQAHMLNDLDTHILLILRIFQGRISLVKGVGPVSTARAAVGASCGSTYTRVYNPRTRP